MTSDRLDHLVRETVHDLADGADVITDRDRRRLALHATEHAHSLRLRRRGAVAGVVALVTALAVGLPYGLRYLGTATEPLVALPAGVEAIDGVPTHVIDDTSQPIELVDGWYVVGNRLVLDRQTMTYRRFPTEIVLPSPDGRWVATQTDIRAYRIHDLRRGTSHRYTYYSDGSGTGTPYGSVTGWSPDSAHLAIAEWSQVTNGELFQYPDYTGGVLTVQSLEPEQSGSTATWLWTLPTNDLGCSPCSLIWLPDGSLGIPVADGIRRVSLTGSLGSVLPVHGTPASPDAWSPDGRHVIVTDDAARGSVGWGPTQLVDVATGEVLREWADLHLTAAQWIDNEHFLTWGTIVTENHEFADGWRAIASLWSLDGTLLERWIPPKEIVTQPFVFAPLAAHLG